MASRAISALCGVVAVFVLASCTGGSPESDPSASLGDELTEMPSVVGVSLADAREALAAAGVLKFEIQRKVSPAEPSEVLGQSPAAGDGISSGEDVTIVVASSRVRTPQLVGLQERAAERVLDDAGLRARVKRSGATRGKDGEVLDQTPESGRVVQPNSRVVLVVRDNGCTPGYSPCLLFAPDYDCPGRSADGPAFPQGAVRVRGSDPYGLDPDDDGYGCE